MLWETCMQNPAGHGFNKNKIISIEEWTVENLADTSSENKNCHK